MLSLEEYLETAEKLIYKFGKFNPSEDDISFVAEYMMRADVKFKEGVGKRELFRVHNGRFAVITLMTRKRKRTQRKSEEPLSLDFIFDRDSSIRRLDLPDKKQKTPDFNFEYNELLAFIESSPIFSDEEREYLKEFISTNCSLRTTKDPKYFHYKLVLRKALNKIGFHYV